MTHHTSLLQSLRLLIAFYCTLCVSRPLYSVHARDDVSENKGIFNCFGVVNPFCNGVPTPGNGSGGHPPPRPVPVTHDVGAIRTRDGGYDIYVDPGSPSTFAIGADFELSSEVLDNQDIRISLRELSRFRTHNTFSFTVTSTVHTPFIATSGITAGDQGAMAHIIIPARTVNSITEEQTTEYNMKMHLTYEYRGELRR